METSLKKLNSSCWTDLSMTFKDGRLCFSLSSPPTSLVHLKCFILTRSHLFFPSSSGSSIISMQWFLPGVMIAYLGISTCPNGLLGVSIRDQSVPMRLPKWQTTHTICVLTSFLHVRQPTSPLHLYNPVLLLSENLFHFHK